MLLSAETNPAVLPQRIISLGPTLTKWLYLMDAGDRVVGVTTYCTQPPEAAEKPKIGNVITADIEKIVGLKPDLVLATSLTSPRSMEKLKSLGIRVRQFNEEKSFEEICGHFLELGKIIGKEKESAGIVAKARKEAGKSTGKLKNLKKPTVFVQIGAKPLFTVTGTSFISDMVKMSGGINIAEKAKSGLYSREKVIADNPDAIIISEMGIAGREEMDLWLKYKTLDAVKNKRIYVLDSYLLCSPTPLSFVEAMEKLLHVLHPEVPEK